MSSPPPGTLIAFIDKTNNEVVAAAVVQLDGSVNIKVPKGSYTVIAAHKDYLVWQQDVEVTEDTTLNITLQSLPEFKPGVIADYDLTVEATDKSLDLPSLSYEVEVA